MGRHRRAFTFHLKESVRADIPAIATEIVDPAERRAVFGAPAAAWYRERTPLADLFAHAPLVHVSFATS